MSSRHEVLARLNAGDPAGAAQVAREILDGSPENGDVQGLLGLALEDAGDAQGALDALRRAVALPAPPSIALRNAANLAAMLVGAGLKEEARDLLRSAWPWLPDVEIGGNEHQCITLLADIMKGLELSEELVAFLLPIAERVPHQWGVVRRAAVALSAVGRHQEALALIEGDARQSSEEPDRQAVLAHLYLQTGRFEKAEAAGAAFSYLAPPYVTQSKPGQWFTVGVLNPQPSSGIRNPHAPVDANTLLPSQALIAQERDQHFNGNYPSQLANRLTDRYRFASILMGAGPSSVVKFGRYGARVLINNVTNAEVLRDGRSLAVAQALADATALPVINPPQRAALCTRQMNFERLSGIPNVVMPRLKRFNLDLRRLDEVIRLTEQSFTYPLIVRTVRDHRAQSIVLVQDRESLRETLQSFRQHPQVYLIQYVGAKRHKGCYRKIRAAVVKGEPLVIWADYSPEWVVPGRSREYRQDFYRSNRDILADANDIVARPYERLGATAMAVLETIGRTVPLDIFGIDFDVDESGRLVFFEANASMFLLSTAPAPDLGYPPAADSLLLERIERLMHQMAEFGTVAPDPEAPPGLGFNV